MADPLSVHTHMHKHMHKHKHMHYTGTTHALHMDMYTYLAALVGGATLDEFAHFHPCLARLQLL